METRKPLPTKPGEVQDGLIGLNDWARDHGIFGNLTMTESAYFFAHGIEPGTDCRIDIRGHLDRVLTAFANADLLNRSRDFPFQVSLPMGDGKYKRVQLMGCQREWAVGIEDGEVYKELFTTICLPNEYDAIFGDF